MKRLTEFSTWSFKVWFRGLDFLLPVSSKSFRGFGFVFRLIWNLAPSCEFDSLSLSEVSRGVRGGPVARYPRWTIPSSSSPSFSIWRWIPALSFQYPHHPCCLLTRNSLPARRPVFFLLRRLREGGRVCKTIELPQAFVSCLLFVILGINVRLGFTWWLVVLLGNFIGEIFNSMLKYTWDTLEK